LPEGPKFEAESVGGGSEPPPHQLLGLGERCKHATNPLSKNSGYATLAFNRKFYGVVSELITKTF